ncbi:MAG: type II secretion system protein M [Legionellaceae bacterium]|nr:type II secretion system protein M [Legionellaceae bacterium]MBP9775727.1 type II secretion system protein M [Legionellaceae bacterium]
MKAHWQQFNEREQTAVVVAGLCLVAYLFYAMLFSPLTTAVSNARKHWYEKNSTLMWMRHAQKNYSQEKQPQKVAAGNLLSILTQVLKHASFHRFPYQLAQTASGEIQLSFDEVPYNAFMEWLRVQSMRYTLTVKNLDVTKTNVSGVVKISVIFGVE